MRRMEQNEVRSVQLDILSAVDLFCRQNNIRYYLSYGTLLGAIRHNGFIPWDDDIDITMPYPDYKIFVNSFNHSIYRVNSVFIDDEYPYHLVKVDDIRTKLIEPTDKEVDIGINIDVSPLIGLPKNKTKAAIYFKKISFWRSIILLSKNVVRKKRSIIKQVPIELIKALPISRKFIIERIDKLSSKYSFDESDYVICVGSFNPSTEIASRDLFSQTEDHVFENRDYVIPIGWDKWLQILFGDYMKFPPEEKRKTHHEFYCYWRQ